MCLCPSDLSAPTGAQGKQPGAIPRRIPGVKHFVGVSVNMGRHVRSILAVGLLPVMFACGLRPSEPATQSFTSMGTRASVTVARKYRDRLPGLTDEVRGIFRTLEGQLSTYQSDSEISRLARAAGGPPLSVSRDTFEVLELSKQYGRLTRGAFDVTVAPLVRLWGFGVPPPTAAPEPKQLEEQLKRVDFRRIELTPGAARLPAGMSIDLGAIGKGFAVDKAFDAVCRTGTIAAVLDLGGNMRVSGQAESGVNWIIGVRNPFDKERLVGKIALPDGMAVATSGSYERFVELGDRRYSHIIDPRTGYPVEGMAGVTVVSPTATEADALSTGLFVLGIQAGLEVLEETPGTEVVFIPDRDPIEIWLTPGMKKVFTAVPEFETSVRILSRPGPAPGSHP